MQHIQCTLYMSIPPDNTTFSSTHHTCIGNQTTHTHTPPHIMTHILHAHIIHKLYYSMHKQHTYTIYTRYTHIDHTQTKTIIHTKAHITYTYNLHNTCVLTHTHTHTRHVQRPVHRHACTTYTHTTHENSTHIQTMLIHSPKFDSPEAGDIIDSVRW